jgi:hypothetical protein
VGEPREIEGGQASLSVACLAIMFPFLVEASKGSASLAGVITFSTFCVWCYSSMLHPQLLPLSPRRCTFYHATTCREAGPPF